MFFIIVCIFFFILLQIIKTLTVKLEIRELKTVFPKYSKKIENKKNKIFLKIYILKRIKILQINLRKSSKNRGRIDKLVQKNGGIKSINFLEIIRKSDFEIEEMKLKIEFGTEDAASTAICVGAISSVLGFLLRNKIKKQEKQFYEISPIYIGENILKIELNGIFSLKIANIIDIIKLLIRKGRVNKNDGTSNRGTYAYSNE